MSRAEFVFTLLDMVGGGAAVHVQLAARPERPRGRGRQGGPTPRQRRPAKGAAGPRRRGGAAP